MLTVYKKCFLTVYKKSNFVLVSITGLSFSAGILRDRLPGSAPISLQWYFSICFTD